MSEGENETIIANHEMPATTDESTTHHHMPGICLCQQQEQINKVRPGLDVHDESRLGQVFRSAYELLAYLLPFFFFFSFSVKQSCVYQSREID